MLRLVFVLAGVASCGALFVACGSSGDDNTVYGPPDAGKPDADYCVVDNDCPPNSGASQACGFPIADTCEARGICVAVGATAQSCPAPNFCGCNGDLVTSCAVPSGYVRGGPTDGKTPTIGDGGTLQCGLGN